MKILLISPGTPDEIDHIVIRSIPYLYAKAFTAPHAIATVAALTPREHEVALHDEYMRGPVENFLPGKTFDIIGISFTSNQLLRCREIAQHCKNLCPQAITVAGGIGVESLLEKNLDHIDVVIHGEAEETWPAFLLDFASGNYKKIYKNIGKPDLSSLPMPRWELLGNDLLHYNSVSLQTTRGCPFDCSFCDVIYTYGRIPRSKTIEQVLAEVKKLSELGVMMVFIADDNFVGNRKYAKELLRQLIPLNNSFKLPLGFFTQLDLTIAEDEELLELLADANFYNLMIGVESVNPASLQDMNKKQNIGVSAVDAIKKIQLYGMAVLAHMIIGADSDDKNIFNQTAKFVQDADIVFHICHPLAAPPGTKMWYDFKRQKRLVTIDMEYSGDKRDIITNIIPKQMSRVELMNGLADYWDSIYSTELFTERAKSFITGISYRPKVKNPGLRGAWALRKLIFGVMKYFMFQASKKDKKAFMQLVKCAKKDFGFLIPRIIYTFTFYMIDVRRSAYDSRVAREMAAFEENNPDKIHMESDEVPVSAAFREHSKEIIKFTYGALYNYFDNPEDRLLANIDALMEYNDRHGKSINGFDDYQKENLKMACERVVQSKSEATIQSLEFYEGAMPAGYSREILDALDNRVRYRKINV